MNAVTVHEAKRTLEDLLQRVITDADPTIVITASGEQVVVVPLDEYNAWEETVYLLSNSANAAHLHASLTQAQAGDVQEQTLVTVPSNSIM